MLRILCLAFTAGAGIASAQIHADFSVSQGTASLGTFRVRLDYDRAPRTCANFIGLATGQRPWVDEATGAVRTGTPYYNGLTFHRLIHDFMIQGGSHNGTGDDGPGYVIRDEFDGTLRHSSRYILSMSNSGMPHTNGSQFFITLEANSSLDDRYSVFGEVISGKEVIDGFINPANFPTDRTVAGASPANPNYFDRPVTPIIINSISIGGAGLSSFNINGQNLPLCSGAAGTFSVIQGQEARYQLHAAQPPGSVLQAYRSSDLRTWGKLGEIYQGTGPSGFSDITLDNATLPRAFYQIPLVNYPDALAPESLANRTLTAGLLGTATFTYTFDSTGQGGTAVYSVNPTQPTPILGVSYERSPYQATWIIETQAYSPLRFVSHLTSENATHILGGDTCSYWNGLFWSSLGGGPLTLTK